jgi:HDOD domain
MPTATHSEARETAFSCHAGAANGFGTAAAGRRRTAASVPEISGPAARLAELLAEDPVDLARVSDEIRAQPALAAMVQRVAASLQLSPEGSARSVEEAAVVLGTDRLRILLHAWPVFEKARQGKPAEGTAPNNAATQAGQAGAALVAGDAGASQDAWTPESLYLASFVRFLKTGDAAEAIPPEELGMSAGGAARSEVAEMTEMLVRDFIALIPSIDPRVMGARQLQELAGASGAKTGA